MPEADDLAAVCQALGARADKRVSWWTVDGPTNAALRVLEGTARRSRGECLMVLVAWGVWNGRGTDASVGDLLTVLDGENLRCVGSLLVALGSGSPSELNGWLAHYGAPPLAEGKP
jgi:hypothetical protein